MRYSVTIFAVLLFFSTVQSWAQNTCTCYPIPESKTYQGEARKKKFIGYTIDWSCKYNCLIEPGSGQKTSAVVTGTYHEHYFRATELGTEGVCEGMVYEPQFVMALGREIYMFHGKTFGIVASDSDAKELRSWASINGCD